MRTGLYISTVARLDSRGLLRKFSLVILSVMTFGLPFESHAVTPSAAPSVTLTPSLASPQPLGTPVTWTASVQNAAAGHTYGYRFTVTFNGQAQIVRDYSPTANFVWVPYSVEGAYQVSVSVRDTTTTPDAYFTPVGVNFSLLPWVSAPLAAAVHPTAHPLVALFSGPPCTVGHQLLVRFRPSTSQVSMTTNLVPCSASSANFYVAGMYPLTQYLMHWEEYNGASLVTTGNDLPFTTGPLPSTFPTNTYTVNVPPGPDDAAYPVLLFQAVYPTAVDLSGKVLWYFPNNTGTGLSVSVLAMPRIEPNGVFYSIPTVSVLQKYDLAGNLILQTNLEIMNEQLVAKGYPPMAQFNSHEVRNLPDGNIVLLGIRNVVSTSAQGGTPAAPVTISGDMALVVDHNLQLVWAWDSFAHQDVNRAATDGDVNRDGSHDWLHTNAAQGTLDGNIILSERAQDMVVKINYAKGKGDGSVIWKMGAGLDFAITNPPSGSCGSPNLIPWFTHQHDSHFDFEDDASGSGLMIMTIFDDGNTRHDKCPGVQNSRGMVLLVDEAARQVTIETSADLGAYSLALGSAQLLTPKGGDLYASFDSGIVQPGGNVTQVSETNLAGQIVYQMQSNQDTYRAYRMQNLYTPSEAETSIGSTGVATGPLSGQPFDFSTGFAQNPQALQFNGSASSSGSALQLTSGGLNQAGSAFFTSPVNIQSFTTDFTFQPTNSSADGFTFTIQNIGPGALGGDGGSLGYATIGNSVAVKFDLFDNLGEGSNSTGLYLNGAFPALPAVDLTNSGINLHSGDAMDAHITYDGTTLTLAITDLVTLARTSHSFVVNIPGTVGGSTAYVGFTGATGGLASTQQILNWSYEAGVVPYAPTGFPSSTGLVTNGSASLSGAALQLTNGGLKEAGSAFYDTPINIQSFTTDFNFQLTTAAADGFTFAIQSVGPTALGGYGGSLGYAGIGHSMAVKFDLFDNAGEGSDSTGVYSNGAIPGLPSINLSSTGIDLHSGHKMHANIAYDGAVLTLTITDLVTQTTWSHPFVIDIPTTIGGTTAYVGFTAGTGGLSATQQILNWTFE